VLCLAVRVLVLSSSSSFVHQFRQHQNSFYLITNLKRLFLCCVCKMSLKIWLSLCGISQLSNFDFSVVTIPRRIFVPPWEMINYWWYKRKVKLFLGFTKYYAMRTCGDMEVQLHAFLKAELYGSEWSASRSGHFIRGESPRHPLDRIMGEPQSWSGHGKR
jgi:hypothetical protein